MIGMPTGGANGARLPAKLEHSGLVVPVNRRVVPPQWRPLASGIEPDLRAEPRDRLHRHDGCGAAAIDYLRMTSKPLSSHHGEATTARLRAEPNLEHFERPSCSGSLGRPEPRLMTRVRK